MSFTDQQFTDWVESYIAAFSNGLEYDPENLAIQEFIDIVHDEPETCWNAIQEIMSHNPNQKVIGALSAGPLEDLIHYHGNDFIERIEYQARVNPAFRHLLGGVWEGGSKENWERVVKARNEASW